MKIVVCHSSESIWQLRHRVLYMSTRRQKRSGIVLLDLFFGLYSWKKSAKFLKISLKTSVLYVIIFLLSHLFRFRYLLVARVLLYFWFLEIGGCYVICRYLFCFFCWLIFYFFWQTFCPPILLCYLNNNIILIK